MRVIAKLRPGPGLQLTEVPVPETGPDDVLIFQEGFDLMRSGRSGKIVLDWSKQP